MKELAQFEWAKIEVFDAADENVLSLTALQEIEPSRWGDLKLGLINNLVVLPTDFRVEDLSATAELARHGPKLSKSATPKRLPGVLKVWRKKEEVFYGLATPDELELMGLVKSCQGFGEVCEKLSTSLGENAPQVAFTILHKWIDDHLLAADVGPLSKLIN